MAYVKGFVAAVPNANREAFRQVAEKHAKIVREFGALKVVDCWGVDVPDGEITSFPKAVQCREDEVVVFSWIIWESKEACDVGIKRMSEEWPSTVGEMSAIVDLKRLFFGGFEVLVEV